MPTLKYWDTVLEDYVPLGGGGGPDEVAIQTDEPAAHPDLWLDLDDNTGAGLMVLGPTAPVPAGTPSGTVIVRTVT